MPLIWLSALCALLMVVLLVLGERTLPLFGGDRDLAARAYKALFMLLGTGLVAGLIPAGFARLARFARARIAEQPTPPTLPRLFLPLFETAGPWLAALIGLAGLGLAVHIWLTQ